VSLYYPPSPTYNNITPGSVTQNLPQADLPRSGDTSLFSPIARGSATLNPAAGNTTSSGSPKSNLSQLRFTKQTPGNAANRGNDPQSSDQGEQRRGKRLRVETDSSSADEVEQSITHKERSLEDYNLSPPHSPPRDDSISRPAAADNLTEAEVKVTSDLLARLQAKDKVTKQPPAFQPSSSATAAAKFTPVPDDGFPVVHGRNATHVFDNIALEQLTDWLTTTGPCIFVQPLSHGYYPPALAQEITGTLKSVIEDIFSCEGVKVTAPIPVTVPNSADYAPYTYFVRNLPDTVATELTKHRCWVTERIGFLAYTADAVSPSYLGAIDGFNATDDDDVTAIRDLIHSTFYQTDVGLILAEISESHPDFNALDPPSRASKILSTLEVRIIKLSAQGGVLRTLANMYIKCPFEKDEDWSRLVEAVAKTEFRHSFLGSGTVRRGWTCTICHGADHPSGICPFPSVPGWINPKPISPIVDYRNRLNQSRRDANATQKGGRRGRGGAGRGDRGNAGRGRGSRARGRGN
jgi:hypothetical protein